MVTDFAVSQLAPFIVNQMLGGRPNGHDFKSNATNHEQNDQDVIQDYVEEDIITEIDKVRLISSSDTHTTDIPVANSDASRLFHSKDGVLFAKIRDFKGTSKKEQQKRFMLLFTWAYQQLMDKSGPSREDFNIGAKNRQIYDENLRTYFTEVQKESLMKIGDSFILSDDGELKVKEILADLDTDAKGAAYWEPGKSKAKGSRVNSEDQRKIDEWVGSEIDLGKFDPLQLKDSSRNWALFALWCVTCHLDKAKAIKPGEAYRFVKAKFVTIPVSQDAFTKALARSYNSKYFDKTSEGLYFLTAEGRAIVEGWRTGNEVSDGSAK